MKIIKNYNIVYLLMSFAMLFWAVAWTNAKIVNEYLSFYNLIFLRFLLGFVCLFPFIIKKNFKIKLSIKAVFYTIGASILFFLYNIAFFKGTHFGNAGRGAVLVTTLNPLVTMFIISIIEKNIEKNEVIGLCLGIIGGFSIMNVFSDGFTVMFNQSNLYFLICAITWGIMTVVINYGQQTVDPLKFIFYCYFITTLFVLPFINVNEFFINHLDARFYINFILVSVGAMSFGTTVYMFSTPILGPVKASVFIFSVPFLALGTAYIFLEETITWNVLFGGVLSLIAIYIVNKKSNL